MDCVFCKIAQKDIQKDFIYEDDVVMVFADIHPVKPVHLLIVPKRHVVDIGAVSEKELFTQLFSVVQQMIQQQKLDGKGYRVVINGGGAQLIDHLHIHLIGPIGKTAKL